MVLYVFFCLDREAWKLKLKSICAKPTAFVTFSVLPPKSTDNYEDITNAADSALIHNVTSQGA